MAYLHCHDCGWEQDDFWDEHYNPIQSMESWIQDLLHRDLNKSFTQDSGWAGATLREVIAQEFERQARKIRGMVWRTEEEYKKQNPKGICPKCSKRLDVD